jgi:threonyl-tRNA synthetase
MFDDYGHEVMTELKKAWVRVSGDFSTDNLNKKVRNAEKMHNNYIVVIWEAEQESGSVAVRNYKTKEQTLEKREDFIARIVAEIKDKTL